VQYSVFVLHWSLDLNAAVDLHTQSVARNYRLLMFCVYKLSRALSFTFTVIDSVDNVFAGDVSQHHRFIHIEIFSALACFHANHNLVHYHINQFH
jgi:hypothetical protein